MNHLENSFRKASTKMTARKSTSSVWSPHIEERKSGPKSKTSPPAATHNDGDLWDKIISHKGTGKNTDYLVLTKPDKLKDTGVQQFWVSLKELNEQRMDLLGTYRKELRQRNLAKLESSKATTKAKPKDQPQERSVHSQQNEKNVEETEKYADDASRRRLCENEPPPPRTPHQIRPCTSNLPQPRTGVVKHAFTQAVPTTGGCQCSCDLARKEARDMSTQTDLSYFIWDCF